MELKQVLLLLLLTCTASTLSLNNIIDQVYSYIGSPPSLSQPSEDTESSDVNPASHPPKRPILRPEVFPCCICSQCACSQTTCPEIRPFPFPPSAHWPVDCQSPIEIATAGCGSNYTVEACLRFVQQYLHALQPALETASNHSGEYLSEQKDKKEKKKVPCCGTGCSDAQCLRYLAVTVKDLQVPINGTLASERRDSVREPASSETESRQVKTEL